MFDLAHAVLPAEKTRALLRKLRDLNLSSGPIAVGRGQHVLLAGCLSTDAPAESGVRYRLRLQDGTESVLEVRAHGEGLEIRTDPGRNLVVQIACDRLGRACSRALGARVMPETGEARELEHFMRRVVRSLFRS